MIDREEDNIECYVWEVGQEVVLEVPYFFSVRCRKGYSGIDINFERDKGFLRESTIGVEQGCRIELSFKDITKLLEAIEEFDIGILDTQGNSLLNQATAYAGITL